MRKLWGILFICLLLTISLSAGGCQAKSDSSGLKIEAAGLPGLANSQTSGHVNILKSLALTKEVQSADWKQINPLLSALNQSDLKARVFFILPDGSAYLPGQNEVASNLADRDYFKPVMTGNVTIGNLVVGKVSNLNSYIIAVPVVKDGKVIAALATTPYLEEMSESLTNTLGIRNNRVFFAQDAGGTVSLSSNLSLIMTKNPAAPKDAVWLTSSLTGWKFALGTK
jgi:C4-dicarboxylate-specific signal transduction histidine kinase